MLAKSSKSSGKKSQKKQSKKQVSTQTSEEEKSSSSNSNSSSSSSSSSSSLSSSHNTGNSAASLALTSSSSNSSSAASNSSSSQKVYSEYEVLLQYKASNYLEREHVIALIEYGYSAPLGQTVEQTKQELSLIKIADSPRVREWSEENQAHRRAEIQNAIIDAANGKPVFFIVADGGHFVSISLLPDESAPGVMKIVYMNSAYGTGDGDYIASKKTGLGLLCELATMVEETNNPRNHTQKLHAQIAQIFLSPSQQLDSNCGVMTAFNIVSLALYWKRKSGINLDLNESGDELKGLPHNAILACNNITDRSRLFVKYVRSIFAAIRDLDVNAVPNTLPRVEVENQMEITVQIIPLVIAQIQHMNDSLVEAELITERINEVAAYCASFDKPQLPGYLQRMVGELIDRHRDATNQDRSKPYTQKELNQAYNLLMLENEKLLRDIDSSSAKANSKEPKQPTKQPLKAESKSQQEIEEDLQKLGKIASLIDELCAAEAFPNKADQISDETISIVIQISELASSINYNDDREGCKEYIRNKYGSVDRSNSAKRREGGLELIQLSAFEKISQPLNQIIDREIYADLLKDFQIIRKKIELILQAEKEPSNKVYKNTLAKLKELGLTANIASFIGYYYVKEIVEALLQIVNDNHLKTLDFTTREDRYYFGRILSMVGELSKDLKDLVSPGKESGLFTFFKSIRDEKMAHSYTALVHYNEGIQQGLYLNALKTLLVKNFTNRMDIVRTNLEEVSKVMSQANSDFWKNIRKCKIKLGNINLRQKKELNKLQNLAFGDEDEVPDDAVLSAIGEEIGNEKAQLPEDYENQVFQKAFDLFSEIEANTSAYFRIIEGKKEKDQKRLPKIQKATLRLIIEYNAIVGDFDNLKFLNLDTMPLLELVDKIKTQLELNLKRERISQEPAHATATIAADIKGDQGARLPQLKSNKTEEKVNQKLAMLAKEFDYMIAVLDNPLITEKKKEYIIYFSYSKVGQIFRDMEKAEKDLIAGVVPDEFLKSVQETERTRNKIMHDIIARRKPILFAHAMYRHTLPMRSEIEAIRQVLQKPMAGELLPDDVDAIFRVGRAYTVLKQYDKAIERFKSMLEIYGSKIILIDASIPQEESLNIWAGIFNAHLGIAEAYGNAGYDQYVKKNLKGTRELNKCKILHLERYIQLGISYTQSKVMQNSLASAHNNLANTYSYLDEYEKAIEAHKKAIGLLKQQKGVSIKREALYLANLGATYSLEYKHRMHLALDRQQDVSEVQKSMQLAIACLWEAREIYSRANMPVASSEFVRVSSRLIQALLYCGGRRRNLLYAQELFQDLKVILARFPARENAQEIQIMEELEIGIKAALQVKYPQELLDKFHNHRELIDIEFELERLNHLRHFYMDIGISIMDDLDYRLTQSQTRLAMFNPSELSLATRFWLEVGILVNQASLLLRQGNPIGALPKYLEALQKSDSIEYRELIPDIIGDLYESIGDTYLALNYPKLALKAFEQSLDQHIKYNPNDRAFRIPGKILELNKILYPEDCIQRDLDMSENAYEGFKKKVNHNDPRLISIKKILFTLYILQGNYNNVLRISQEINEKNFSQQEKALLHECKQRVNSSNERKEEDEEVASTPTQPSSVSQKNAIIEKEVLRAASGLTPDCKDANLYIDISNISKSDLIKYCESELNIAEPDLDFDNSICTITMGKKSIDILRKKLSAQNVEAILPAISKEQLITQKEEKQPDAPKPLAMKEDFIRLLKTLQDSGRVPHAIASENAFIASMMQCNRNKNSKAKVFLLDTSSKSPLATTFLQVFALTADGIAHINGLKQNPEIVIKLQALKWEEIVAANSNKEQAKSASL